MCGLIILQSIKVQGYKTVNVNTQQVIEKLYKSILSKPRVTNGILNIISCSIFIVSSISSPSVSPFPIATLSDVGYNYYYQRMV